MVKLIGCCYILSSSMLTCRRYFGKYLTHFSSMFHLLEVFWRFHWAKMGCCSKFLFLRLLTSTFNIFRKMQRFLAIMHHLSSIFLSYRNQLNALYCKSIKWFIHDSVSIKSGVTILKLMQRACTSFNALNYISSF